MSTTPARPLDEGAPFPELEFETIAHGRMRLPDAIAGKWTVVLIYRGHT